MSDKDHQNSVNPFQMRCMDPIMERQLKSEHHCFRVVGELRYLLEALIQDLPEEECWSEFSKRALLSLLDPCLIDKVAAQRLLKELYDDFMSNFERVRWLDQKFLEMDPGNPVWAMMKERADQKEDPIKGLEKPGSASACLMFLELCLACNNKRKTMDALMNGAGPALVAMGLEAPLVPPTEMEARKRHMENVETDSEYRREMESAKEVVLQAIDQDPRILDALRESLKMARFIGFPADSTAKEDFAVVREEMDALLHAVKTGEISLKKKQRDDSGKMH